MHLRLRFLHRPAIRRGQQEQAILEFDKQLWLIPRKAADIRLFMFTASGFSPGCGLGHVTQTAAETHLSQVPLCEKTENCLFCFLSWSDVLHTSRNYMS